MHAALLTLLIATSPGDFAKNLKSVFRPTRAPSQVYKFRARSLAGAPAKLDQEDLEALIDCYVQLEKELEPLEASHLDFLERGHRDKLREPRPDVDGLRELMESITALLNAVEDPESARLLCDKAVAGKRLPIGLRLTMTGTGRLLRGAEVGDLVKRANKARSEEDRLVTLALAEALKRAGSSLAEQAIEALTEENDILRGAAIDALVATAPPEGLPHLVERLNVETGRLKARAAAALQVLTGARIHASSKAWRKWLEEEGQPYLEGERTLGHGKPIATNPGVGADYYGVPLDGDGLLFVLDISKSMTSPLRKPKDGQPASESRAAQAKAELTEALGQLPPSKKFGIIAFGGTLERFSKELLFADPKNVAEAQLWVADLKLNLGTRLHDALQLAFADAGRSERGDALFDPQADTIFLLTDGTPIIAGKRDKAGAILSAARRFNLRRHLVIHTIGLGTEIPKGFLKSLAQENGGQFVHEKGTQ